MWSCQVLVVALYLHTTWSLSPLWDSVKTNVHQEYDVQEGNNQVWVVRMNMGEYKANGLVVGEDIRPDSRIILTCTAWYPAEWVYSGDGKPEFTTNTTIENFSSGGDVLPLEDMNGAKRYVATLTVGKNRLKTTDTGRYNCMTASPETGMKYKTLSAFYHLYVPGDKLFMREGTETINYDLRKSPARIPCGVTNPKTVVSLQKFENGKLKTISKMFYHPISGYYPKQELPGTYVCTAALNNKFQLIYFTLIPASSLGSSYNNSLKRKPIKGTNKAEDLEWLMYSTPVKNRTTSKKPRPRPTFSPSKLTKTTTPYVPFHIRYTSTYGPFFTFSDSSGSIPSRPPHHQNLSPSKYKPFSPFEYPSEIITEESTKRPFSSHPTKSQASPVLDLNSFEQKIYNSQSQPTSYEPIFNYYKESQKPSLIHSQRPTGTIITANKIKQKQRTTIFPTRLTRTTPRKYYPKTISTTEMSVLIPQQVICSQVSCGIHAECIVINVFYSTKNETMREAACKCKNNYTGNPYLECLPPIMHLDQDVLYFNSSFRSPLKHESIRTRPDGEVSLSSDKQGATLLPLDIIDM